jgi:deoxyinosine 3'endonuclease (endonuclease V)
LRRVAGLDCAFSTDGERCIAGAVVWDLHEQCVVEERLASRPLRLPYVPGLLSFREAPALLAVLRQLKSEPDVRPIYVSVGRRSDLPGAETLVLACDAGYCLPEPTRLADSLVAQAKREEPKCA